MNLKKNTKIVTFTESYRRETYVAFAEGKTESYVFDKFLLLTQTLFLAIMV